MADTKISAATLTTPQTTDLIPLARGGSSVARHATVAALVQAQAASTTAVGSVELATAAETRTGTSSTLAVTPAGLAAYFQQDVTFGVAATALPTLNLATYEGEIYSQVYSSYSTHEGNVNELFGIGFNSSDRVAGKATWILGLEYDYYPTPIVHYAEAYFAFTDTDGVTSVRPWQVNVDRDSLDCMHQFYGLIYFNDSDGAQLLKIDESKVIFLYNGTVIKSLTNNANFISQVNSSGADVPIIKINASDVVEIGSSTKTKFASGISLSLDPIATLGNTDVQVGDGGGIVSIDYATTGLERVVTARINTNHWPYAIDCELGNAGSHVYSKGPHRMTVLTAEPGYKPDGLLVYADGTSWNPGSGAGFYGREGAAWVKL